MTPFAAWFSSFRLRLCLLAACFGACGLAQAIAATAWLHKAQVGNVVYFTFASPARLERYDLANEKWLPSVKLTNSPTAFAADADGLSVAYGRAVYTRKPDGTGEAALYNSANDVRALLHSPDFIVVASTDSWNGILTTIRRSDRQFVATWSATYALSAAHSIDPVNRRVFGVNTFHSGAETNSVTFNADGTWPSGYKSGGSYYYTSAHQPRSYIAPDGAVLVLGAGYVYDPVALTYRASLAGLVEDLAFYGNDTPIVLRQGRLVAYSNFFLESGSIVLAGVVQGISISGDQVFCFSADPEAASGLSVAKIAISSFSSAVPGAAVDPEALEFIPDQVIDAGDDTFLLFSKTHQSVFRWSAASAAFTASYSLRSGVGYVAYSADSDRLYTGYSSGEIRQVDFAAESPVETPFVNLPLAVEGLQTAGANVFAVDGSGAWNTFWVYGPDGAEKSSREWSEYSRDYVWSAVQGRMFHFRDGTSPNDLEYASIGADGVLGIGGETPYHGNYSFTHPIRLSTDETGVLIGSGNIFSATTLVYVGSLANAITDAVSINNRWHTIRSNGTDTQLQVWSQNYLFERGLTIPGYPFRVFGLADGRLLVLTSTGGPTSNNSWPYNSIGNTGRLIYSFVDLSGEGTVSNAPFITAAPGSATVYRGRPATLTVSVSGTGPLTYVWKFKGEILPAATGATLSLASVKDTDAGAYTVTVSNALGSVTSGPATLTVATPPPAPQITTEPQDTVAVEGGYFNGLHVVASGVDLSYQWYRNDMPIEGATSSTYGWTWSFSAAAYGDYRVVVSNPGGDISSVVAKVVPPPAPVIVEDPLDVYSLPGQTAYFFAVVNAAGASYQWRRDGINLPEQIYPELQIYDVSELDFGSYDVVVTNAAGSATSRPARLIRAQPADIVSHPVSATVGLGGDISFGVVAGGLPATFAYQWQRYSPVAGRWVWLTDDGVSFDGVTTATLAVLNAPASLNGTQVRCLVNNGFGGIAVSAPATITVSASPVETSLRFTTEPSNQSVAVGGVAVFVVATNAVGPVSYQWYHDGAIVPDATAASLVLNPVRSEHEGNYTVIARSGPAVVVSQPGRLTIPTGPSAPVFLSRLIDVSGLLGGEVKLRVDVQAHPAPTYVWRRGKTVLEGFTGETLWLRPLIPADAGIYTVTATNSAGSATATIRLGLSPTPPAVVPDLSLHVGTTVHLNLAEPALIPVRYLSSGLPAGLVLDSDTGLLFGTVTGSPKTYAVRVWTQVASLKSEVREATFTVASFPVEFTGGYELLLVASSSPYLPWGKVQITVGIGGQFTGTLQTATAVARSVRGRFRVDSEGAAAFANVTLPDGVLALALGANGSCSAEVLVGDTFVAQSERTLKVRDAKAPAVAWSGSYTLGFGAFTPLSEAGTPYPAGEGYATAKIATNGKLAAKGRLADGTAITAALSAGEGAAYDFLPYYLWFVRPHKDGENYFGGWALLLRDEYSEPPRYDVGTSSEEQAFYWKKSAQSGNSAYAAGFGPLKTDVRMQAWFPPSRTVNLAARLGFDTTPAPIAPGIVIDGMDWWGTPYEDDGLPSRLLLAASNVFSVPSDTPATNARAWSLKVTASTGQFTGSFLMPADPEGGGRAHTVKFEGVLFQPGSNTYGGRGAGFFLLPPAVSGEPTRSGAIYFNHAE